MDDRIIGLIWPDVIGIEEFLRCLYEKQLKMKSFELFMFMISVEWKSSVSVSKGTAPSVYVVNVKWLRQCRRCSLEKASGTIAISLQSWKSISSQVLLWYLERMNFAIWCPYFEILKWSQLESFSYLKWNPIMTCPLPNNPPIFFVKDFLKRAGLKTCIDVEIWWT